MALPITIPFTFGNATTTQSLSSLDTNFTTITNSVNGLTNGASQINVASISATGTANATTFLRGDGAWANVSGGGGSGTVTSINANSSIGFTFTGGPVTSSGTLTLSGPTPGTSGNVLTSNGTAWISQSASGAVSSVNGFTGAVQSVIVQGTANATTSGTSIDFIGIPSWARRVIVIISGVSTSSTSPLLIQLGSGSITNTGYASGGWTSSATYATATNGLLVSAAIIAAAVQHGVYTLALVTGNTWVGSGSVADSSGSNYTGIGSGTIALSGALDRVRITTATGVPTFDAGTINIQYE